MKTNEEINRYFCEEVFKKCWHELSNKNYSNVCIKCKRIVCELYPDYFSKEGFWDIWEWAIKQDWFHDFVHENVMLSTLTVSSVNDLIESIDYKTLAREVYNFLELKK